MHRQMFALRAVFSQVSGYWDECLGCCLLIFGTPQEKTVVVIEDDCLVATFSYGYGCFAELSGSALGMGMHCLMHLLQEIGLVALQGSRRIIASCHRQVVRQVLVRTAFFTATRTICCSLLNGVLSNSCTLGSFAKAV